MISSIVSLNILPRLWLRLEFPLPYIYLFIKLRQVSGRDTTTAFSQLLWSHKGQTIITWGKSVLVSIHFWTLLQINSGDNNKNNYYYHYHPYYSNNLQLLSLLLSLLRDTYTCRHHRKLKETISTVILALF